MGRTWTLFAATFAATDSKTLSLTRSLWRLVAEINQGFHYVAGVPALLGWCWSFGSLRRDAGFWLLTVFGLLHSFVLVALAMSVNYVSDRHVMILVLLGCFFVAIGLRELPAPRFGAVQVGSNGNSVSLGAVLVRGLVACPDRRRVAKSAAAVAWQSCGKSCGGAMAGPKNRPGGKCFHRRRSRLVAFLFRPDFSGRTRKAVSERFPVECVHRDHADEGNREDARPVQRALGGRCKAHLARKRRFGESTRYCLCAKAKLGGTSLAGAERENKALAERVNSCRMKCNSRRRGPGRGATPSAASGDAGSFCQCAPRSGPGRARRSWLAPISCHTPGTSARCGPGRTAQAHCGRPMNCRTWDSRRRPRLRPHESCNIPYSAPVGRFVSIFTKRRPPCRFAQANDRQTSACSVPGRRKSRQESGVRRPLGAPPKALPLACPGKPSRVVGKGGKFADWASSAALVSFAAGNQ